MLCPPTISWKVPTLPWPPSRNLRAGRIPKDPFGRTPVSELALSFLTANIQGKHLALPQSLNNQLRKFFIMSNLSFSCFSFNWE